MNVIAVTSSIDLRKLLAFLRVRAKVVFSVANEELRDAALHQIREFARQHRVSVQFAEPSMERLVSCALTGALVGAGLGGSVGGLPGAALGAGAGSIAGCVFAHLRVTVRSRGDGEPGFFLDLTPL